MQGLLIIVLLFGVLWFAMIDRRRSNDNTQLADRGRRLREMLDELGPTFVKFGQLLSTRPDVVPPDIDRKSVV